MRKSRTRSALRWFSIYLQFPFGNSERSTFNNTSAHRITNSLFSLWNLDEKAAWRFADARVRKRRKISNRVDEIWVNLFDAPLELSRKLRSFIWCVTANADYELQNPVQSSSNININLLFFAIYISTSLTVLAHLKNISWSLWKFSPFIHCRHNRIVWIKRFFSIISFAHSKLW